MEFKMYKEMIICIVIVVTIFLGNSVTQNYTKESVNKLSRELISIREDITQKDINNDDSRNKIGDVYNEWVEINEKLAYFIEHDELEKVETELTSIKSYIETEQYDEAVNELDKNVYILKHIEDKYAFNLQNIF